MFKVVFRNIGEDFDCEVTDYSFQTVSEAWWAFTKMLSSTERTLGGIQKVEILIEEEEVNDQSREIKEGQS